MADLTALSSGLVSHGLRKKRSRAAPHPTNAMPNYGYGILKNKIPSQVVASGFDPTIGILHGNSQNKIPLVYDLMEPYRPAVDRVILEFALSHEFAPADFTISKWGGCRLNPQMARQIVKQIAISGAGSSVVNDALAPSVR